MFPQRYFFTAIYLTYLSAPNIQSFRLSLSS